MSCVVLHTWKINASKCTENWIWKVLRTSGLKMAFTDHRLYTKERHVPWDELLAIHQKILQTEDRRTKDFLHTHSCFLPGYCLHAHFHFIHWPSSKSCLVSLFHTTSLDLYFCRLPVAQYCRSAMLCATLVWPGVIGTSFVLTDDLPCWVEIIIDTEEEGDS